MPRPSHGSVRKSAERERESRKILFDLEYLSEPQFWIRSRLSTDEQHERQIGCDSRRAEFRRPLRERPYQMCSLAHTTRYWDEMWRQRSLLAEMGQRSAADPAAYVATVPTGTSLSYISHVTICCHWLSGGPSLLPW